MAKISSTERCMAESCLNSRPMSSSVKKTKGKDDFDLLFRAVLRLRVSKVRRSDNGGEDEVSCFFSVVVLKVVLL